MDVVSVLTLTHCCILCVCVRVLDCMCASHDRDNGTGGHKMCPSSLCNYLPIFSPSVAFIIPFRSHLEVGDCHCVTPPSLSLYRMKCRSPSTDLCLPAPNSLSPYLFPRNRRHLEIRIISISHLCSYLFSHWRGGGRGWVLLFDTDSRWHERLSLFLPAGLLHKDSYLRYSDIRIKQNDEEIKINLSTLKILANWHFYHRFLSILSTLPTNLTFCWHALGSNWCQQPYVHVKATFTTELSDSFSQSDVTFGQAKKKKMHIRPELRALADLTIASLPIMQLRVIHEEANPL